ncbi:MAG: CcdB family protein [Hyphomonadaceae bacterium]
MISNPNQIVLVLQYPGLDFEESVIVARLVNAEKFDPLDLVTPKILLGQNEYYLAIHQMAAINTKDIGEYLGSALEDDYAISRALDRLFFGN